jgi:hypothetical protein
LFGENKKKPQRFGWGWKKREGGYFFAFLGFFGFSFFCTPLGMGSSSLGSTVA